MSRSNGLLVATCAAIALLVSATGTASAASPPSGAFIPGVVEPPPLGLSLHNDLVWPESASASAVEEPVSGDTEVITTPDGLRVHVETSRHYRASLKYDESLVGFLDSLVHGHELDGLKVFVASPSEMERFCGGRAAACYFALQERIYIVGQKSFAGLPTTYILAHEYGHRIEVSRPNPPFPGGALFWGAKRWASVEGVCRGYLNHEYAPGNEGRYYQANPGEAFAESYAWSHFGPRLREWNWVPSLHPNATAYAAIRKDVLDPWKPQLLEDQGSLSAARDHRTYRLRAKNDGLFRVTLTGSRIGSLGLDLFNARGRLLALSSAALGAEKHLNYVICGDRKLRLVVRGTQPPDDFQLRIVMP